MHIVPAPAESLMKSRVLSIPGLQGVKDETWDGYRLFRLSGGAGLGARAPVNPHPRFQVFPLGSRSRISASITCSPGHCRPAGGNMEAEILREPWEDLEVPQT